MTDSIELSPEETEAMPMEIAADVAGGNVRVTHISFGLGAGVTAWLVLGALAALCGWLIERDRDHFGPFKKWPESSRVVWQDYELAIDPPQPSFDNDVVDEQEIEIVKGIDTAFQTLDRTDMPSVNGFLLRWSSHHHAIKLGYVDDLTRLRGVLRKQEDRKEAEYRRKQKEVPWDME